VNDSSEYPILIAGRLVASPEPVRSGPRPQTFLFLDAGGQGMPQEILCEGAAAVNAEAFEIGDPVACSCYQDGALWRCGRVDWASDEARDRRLAQTATS
jgi:hypothetical protein